PQKEVGKRGLIKQILAMVSSVSVDPRRSCRCDVTPVGGRRTQALPCRAFRPPSDPDPDWQRRTGHVHALSPANPGADTRRRSLARSHTTTADPAPNEVRRSKKTNCRA